MITGFAQALLEINLAAGAAIAFVLLVRKPARSLMGPRAVYLMWAIVPMAMLATLIPSRTVVTPEPVFPDRVVVTAYIPREGIDWVGLGLTALLIAWAIGAVMLGRALIKRQALFHRDAELGKAGPAVVGFNYPYIVTPKDFALRFSHEERKLILAHEQIHLERRDPRVNAIVEAVRCLCWFNPLAHVGAIALRIDQELACDAEVIDRRPNVRRAYAETLLKTQLAARPLPVGCYWPSESPHPLAERIAMLTHSPLSVGRRVFASIAVVVLAGSGGVAAWAAQPERTVFTAAPEVFVPFLPIVRHEHPAGAMRSGDAVIWLDKVDTEPLTPP
ncbi:MAG: M56 family metallopeptidase [Hyphomonadaceae bacterium]|nr:M56 family metallopeptidase [Hyphomonadaceae bacterium]